jgi:Domain of unknown function (DUF4402)
MSRRLSLLHCFGISLSLAIPAAGACAAPVTQSASAEVALLHPLTVIKRADLDFGTIVASGAGTAVIDPLTSAIATTGSLIVSGTAAHPAKFTATGSRNAVALIRLPKNPATLTRVGGTQTLTVSNWTVDGNINRRIPANETFDFYVGGTLNVAAGQTDGTYVGTFTVTVQYP